MHSCDTVIGCAERRRGSRCGFFRWRAGPEDISSCVFGRRTSGAGKGVQCADPTRQVCVSGPVHADRYRDAGRKLRSNRLLCRDKSNAGKCARRCGLCADRSVSVSESESSVVFVSEKGCLNSLSCQDSRFLFLVLSLDLLLFDSVSQLLSQTHMHTFLQIGLRHVRRLPAAGLNPRGGDLRRKFCTSKVRAAEIVGQNARGDKRILQQSCVRGVSRQ